MFQIKTMNKIAQQGLDVLAENGFLVNAEAENPDGLLIRSAKIHDETFGDRLLAIARAGVGVDNVPLDRCTEDGIAVFNTAGANAEAVKELAICALLLASRDVAGGIEWVKSIAPAGGVAAAVEKGKSAYAGPEINGKCLGIIGLGAIGALVANTAVALGMDVWGYDPYLSVDAAWRLSSDVNRAADLETLCRMSDYIMVQVHYNDSTRGMIDASAIAKMKAGVRIINLARGELVDDDAMLAALSAGKVARYVTDFPNEKLVGAQGVVAMPHLGASTPESEDKCAVMAAQELADYLKSGNTKNAINLPDVKLDRAGAARLCVIHRNVPRMIHRFLDLIGAENINVEHMINKARGKVAYTIIDIDGPLSAEITDKIAAMNEVLRVRVL